jgi:ATP-dependent helicase YprA (DUF1998 family)
MVSIVFSSNIISLVDILIQITYILSRKGWTSLQVYEGAVYMHQGKTYLVKTLDLSAKIALCQEADLKYYTKTRDFTDIHVTGGELVSVLNPCALFLTLATI